MTQAPESEIVSKKEELINGFKSARRAVFQSFVGLEEADMTTPINDEGLTVKDLLAHWIEWDRLEIERTETFLDGHEIDMQPDEDNNGFNKASIEKWKDRTAADAVVAFRQSTNDVEKLLHELTEEELFRDRRLKFTVEKNGIKEEHVVNPAWFLVENDHDMSHAREIEVWKKEVGIGGQLQTT